MKMDRRLGLVDVLGAVVSIFANSKAREIECGALLELVAIVVRYVRRRTFAARPAIITCIVTEKRRRGGRKKKGGKGFAFFQCRTN